MKRKSGFLGTNTILGKKTSNEYTPIEEVIEELGLSRELVEGIVCGYSKALQKALTSKRDVWFNGEVHFTHGYNKYRKVAKKRIMRMGKHNPVYKKFVRLNHNHTFHANEYLSSLPDPKLNYRTIKGLQHHMKSKSKNWRKITWFTCQRLFMEWRVKRNKELKIITNKSDEQA